jgi:hypothetical protein
MKAKISYTINLEEIPKEVTRLMSRLQRRLLELSHDLTSISEVSDTNIAGRIESIDNLRRSMAEIDMRLEDCYSILTGYHQAVGQGFHKVDSPEDLNSKLNDLTRSLGNVNPEKENGQDQ